MCYIAFFAFLRIGEITVNGSDQSNLIRLNQLSRLMTTQGQVVALQLTICEYKHSTNGPPFVIDIFQEEYCCPVKAVLAFISVRGTTSGPLFCWPGRAPVKRSIFVEQLNRAPRFCNLDPTLYKAHSFRIGAATWAAAKGLSNAQIHQLGRWKSNAFLSYIIRTPSLTTHAASS